MLFTVNNNNGRLLLDLDSMKATKSERKISGKKVITYIINML